LTAQQKLSKKRVLCRDAGLKHTYIAERFTYNDREKTLLQRSGCCLWQTNVDIEFCHVLSRPVNEALDPKSGMLVYQWLVLPAAPGAAVTTLQVR
jgi:hypothetical protein